jgi:5'-nucleotidase
MALKAMTRPLFLITNDDGIQAQGIKHLWHALHDFADLAIVAPHTEKSGSGLAITTFKPLRITKVPWEDHSPAWSINGTPADCVKMALRVLLPKLPDLVLSGVNIGSNSGRTLLYSGTVGGAIEGTMQGLPALAFSFVDHAFPPLGSVRSLLLELVQYFYRSSIPSGALININLPHNCHQGIQGIRMAKQGRGYWLEDPAHRVQPEGTPYYWLGARWSDHEEQDSHSDVALLQQGYVTAVPVQIFDLTHHDLFQQHQEKIQNLPF